MRFILNSEKLVRGADAGRLEKDALLSDHRTEINQQRMENIRYVPFDDKLG